MDIIYCERIGKIKQNKATMEKALTVLLLFSGKLLELIEKENITIWKGVPSLLMYVARTVSLKKKKLPSLNKIIFSGERLPVKYLIEWMKVYPEKKFFNAYGPTEATGISTCFRIKKIPKDPMERIPIGTPCSNTEVFILIKFLFLP